jgi:hypothetical protein
MIVILRWFYYVYSSYGYYLVWLPCPLMMVCSLLERDFMRFIKDFAE